jgi:hypothetical protein
MEYWWSYHRTKKQEQEREGEGHAIVFLLGSFDEQIQDPRAINIS